MGRTTGAGLPDEIKIAGERVIEPHSRIVDAFAKAGYSIEAAVADLVDNSIDAGARNVIIRFRRTNDELLCLFVIDDGHGMSEREIDRAMRFGGQRQYSESELGMYGMGMKSASLSQARTVSVFSRARNSRPTGRQWTEEGARKGWRCGIVSPDSVGAQLSVRPHAGFSLAKHGTVIRWDEVRDFQKASGRVDPYLKKVTRGISNHLGLQLHRFIQRGAVSIGIDSENVETGVVGVRHPVTALDPFDYPVSGAKGYPKTFSIDAEGVGEVSARAHIWPARSKLPGYRLGGGSVSQRQGFYFYRNDRLIQAGGWNYLRDDAEPHLSLARVAIDLPAGSERFFAIRFTKAGVDAPHSFVHAIKDATASDGSSFDAYIQRAIDVYRTRSTQTLPLMIPPGEGMPVAVVATVKKVMPMDRREGPLDIVWDRLPAREFFRIDRETTTLTLNNKYRSAVLQGTRGSKADAPLVKALLYLLLNDAFRTERESAIEKARLDGYQKLLLAAVKGQAHT